MVNAGSKSVLLWRFTSGGVLILQYIPEVFGPGGPNTSKCLDSMGVYLLQRGSKYFSTSLKYLDPGVQILRSIWTGEPFGGGPFFSWQPHEFREALSGCDKDMTTGKLFMQYNVGDTLNWHFVARDTDKGRLLLFVQRSCRWRQEKEEAALCYKCEKVLNSIDSLSAKIESLKADVRAKGSSLQIARMCNVHVMHKVYYSHVTHTT